MGQFRSDLERSRRWLTALGSALAVLLVIVGAALGAPLSEHTPGSRQPTATPQAGKTTGTTTRTTTTTTTARAVTTSTKTSSTTTSSTHSPPVNPRVACSAARQQLLGLLGNANAATAASYENRDTSGFTTDTIKIIQIPQGYLGVYHVSTDGVNFSVRLGFSTNLLHWYYVTTLATGASQPTIYQLPNGAFLVAYEKDDPGGLAHLEFRDYPSIDAIASGQYDSQYDAPRTLSSVGEGTPNIRAVTMNGSLANSTIQVGFHYNDTRLGRDREGLGTLTDFARWRAQVNTTLNVAFRSTPGGEVGGRDYFAFEGCPFTVIEAQSVLNSWSSWRVYLYDETNAVMTQIPVRTAGGSSSFGNPKVAVVTDPNGNRALLVSYFIFAQGSFPGEAGPLIFYTDF